MASASRPLLHPVLRSWLKLRTDVIFAAAMEYPREPVESSKAAEHIQTPLIRDAIPFAVCGKQSVQYQFG